MTTRKRNLIIAAAAAIVIAAAAVITVVTLNTQSEAEKVNNTLALMGDPNAAVSDISDNRNAAVTVGGSDNGTPIVIGETEDSAVINGEEDIFPESEDALTSGKDNAEKEDTPDSGAAPSDKLANTSGSDYPETPEQGSASASSNTQTNKPAVTVVTTAPAVTTPPSTVRNDLPKVTAEPEYTTAPTDKPAQTEPVVEKYDSNGFPANPVTGQEFTDSNGNTWAYMDFVGWVAANGDGVLQEFPDFYVEGGDEIILS